MHDYNRTRRTGGFAISQMKKTDWLSTGDLIGTADYQPAFLSEGSESIMSDQVHPGYAKRKQRGELIFGPLSRTTETVVTDASYFNIGPFPNFGRTLIEGNLAHWSAVGINEDSNFLSEAMTNDRINMLVKAYAKMNESPLLSGEFLHDLKQTLSMIRRPLKGSLDHLGKIFKRRRQLLRKSGSNLVQASGNAWLEYRYGWMPLLLDCETAVDETNKVRSQAETQILVARSSNQLKYSFVRNTEVAKITPTSQITRDGVSVSNMTVETFGGVIYEVKLRSTPEMIIETLGLRPRDILVTMWEVTPLSWVADWFVGIGDWLQAVSSVPGVTPLKNWVTQKMHIVRRETVDWHFPKQTTTPHAVDANVGTVQTDRQSVTRTVNLELPFNPQWVVKPLGLLHTTDGLALSTGRILSMLKTLAH